MLLLLVGTGVYLTARTGCIQAAKFGYIMRNTVGSLFRRREKRDKDAKNLTPFQAVTTALAGTVGTGNIAGVTGAIFAGGPGAVFWMWFAAFFGMFTKICGDRTGPEGTGRLTRTGGPLRQGPCITSKRAWA